MSFATAAYDAVEAYSNEMLACISFILSFLRFGATALLLIGSFWFLADSQRLTRRAVAAIPALLPSWWPTQQGVLCALQLMVLIPGTAVFVVFAVGLWATMAVRWVVRNSGGLVKAVYDLRTVDLGMRAALVSSLASLDAKRVGLVEAINVTCLQKRRELLEELSDLVSLVRRELPQKFQAEFMDRLSQIGIDVPRAGLPPSTGRRFPDLPSRFAAFLYGYDRKCLVLEHSVGHVQDGIASLERQLRRFHKSLSEGQQRLDDERAELRQLLASLRKQTRVARDAGIPFDRRGLRTLGQSVRSQLSAAARAPVVVVSGPSSQKVVKPAEVGSSGPMDLAPVRSSERIPSTVASSSGAASTVIDTPKAAIEDSGVTARHQQLPQQQQQQQMVLVAPVSQVQRPVRDEQRELSAINDELAADADREQQHQKRLLEAKVETARALYQEAQVQREIRQLAEEQKQRFEARLENVRRDYQQYSAQRRRQQRSAAAAAAAAAPPAVVAAAPPAASAVASFAALPAAVPAAVPAALPAVAPAVMPAAQPAALPVALPAAMPAAVAAAQPAAVPAAKPAAKPAAPTPQPEMDELAVLFGKASIRDDQDAQDDAADAVGPAQQQDDNDDDDVDDLTMILADMSIQDHDVSPAAGPSAAGPSAAGPSAAAGPSTATKVVVADEVKAVPASAAVSLPVAMEVVQPDEDAPSAAPSTNAPGPSVVTTSTVGLDQLPPLPEDDDGDYLLDAPVPVVQAPPPQQLPVITPVPSSAPVRHTVPAVAQPVHTDYSNVAFTMVVPRGVPPAPPAPMAVATSGTGGPRFSTAFLAAAKKHWPAPTTSVAEKSAKAKGKEPERAPTPEKSEKAKGKEPERAPTPEKSEKARGKEPERAPPAKKTETWAAPRTVIDADDVIRLLTDDDIDEMDALLEQALLDEAKMRSKAQSSSAAGSSSAAASSSSASVPVTTAPAPAVSFAATVDAQDQAVWDALADASDHEDAVSAPAVAPPAPVPAAQTAPAPEPRAPTPPPSIPPPGQRRIIATRRRTAQADLPSAPEPPKINLAALRKVTLPAPVRGPVPAGRHIIAPRRRLAQAAAAPPAAEPRFSPRAPPTAAAARAATTAAPAPAPAPAPAQQQSGTPPAHTAVAPPQHAPSSGSNRPEPRALEQFEMAALKAKREDSVRKLALAMLADSYNHHLKMANELTPEELREARDNIAERLDAIILSTPPAVALTYECADCDLIMEKWVHQHSFSASSPRVAEAEQRIIDSMKKGAKGAAGKFRRRYLRFAGWTGC